ncbi:glycoside hydrolase family 3 protein [Niveispirillum sp. KHB5.9]|uniref:glycoside hydrolase family 3 protein n=1 Tax=Niveispirillum sp. KHB5.9 TaxID=3400269 RepID=UPI003A85255B
MTSKRTARLARALGLVSALALVAGLGGVLTADVAFSADGPATPAQTLHPEKWPAAKAQRLIDPAIEKKIDALMAKMSVEEKVGQTIQGDISTIKPADLRKYPLGSILAGGNSGPGGDDRAPAQAWLDLADEFYRVSVEKREGHTQIPVIFGVDAVHGHGNIGAATIFPHNIALGATRDRDLLRRTGEVTAREMAATGIDWTFAPALSVVRDDRWGRSYEGFSEDPEIVAAYAGAVVEGIQGTLGAKDWMKPGRTVATAKHFLADGGTDQGRDQGDAKITEEELVRLHNAGYPPAIDAGVLTIMTSFSSWQNIKHHGNKQLMTDVLKGRMGFNGFIVGDWNAHDQVPGCTKFNCPTSLIAGLDMYMASDSWELLYKNTLAQVKDGTIPMARLDDAVRRILRVKFHAGLFDKPAPKDRKDVPAIATLGSAENRAVGREAVAKSLVLLKNQGGVLPLSPKSRVLVAGDGADNIGKQAGGWTISWQGTGNRNDEFPGATSILGGIKEAVAAGGGTVAYDKDGKFTAKPDVAIVVFGEEPYAEFQGDVETLEYQPGDKSDLTLLKKLKAQGIPTVAVFLSGRPMWVNPEINASDAFVAAWLPGTEGNGIADVLFKDKDGKINRDFTGKLSFSWPKTAIQTPLNRGDANYDPQFAYGFGLTYKDKGDLAALSEASGVPAGAGAASGVFFRRGGAPAPWSLAIADKVGDLRVTTTTGTSPGKVVDLKSVDVAAQEDAKQLTWNGTGLGTFVISGRAIDLSRQSNGDVTLSLRYRVDQAPTGKAHVSMICGNDCRASLDVTKILADAKPGTFQTTKISLKCFAAAGARMATIDAPVVISTEGRLGLTVTDLKLDADPGNAVCPGK